MTIDPTREEWQAAHTRANAATGTTRSIVEAALGPCPPEPAPETWRHDGMYTLEVDAGLTGGVRVGYRNIVNTKLTPDEALAMAGALTEHARYAREQGT